MLQNRLCLIGYLLLMNFAFADGPKAEGEPCGASPRPARFGVRHIEAKGIGYSKGYTTLEAFLGPNTEGQPIHPFLDLRGHVFNDGRIAANIGFGLRYLNWYRVWGGNIYYDFRNSSQFNANQVALGLESLGLRWDYRINGYFPVGRTKSNWYDPSFDEFVGHELFIRRKQRFSMTGVHAEAAAHLNQGNTFEGYAAAGPYYFGGQGKNCWGGQVRFRGSYEKFFSIEARYSWDTVFHSIVQGEIAFNLPLGPRSIIRRNECQPVCCDLSLLKALLVQPVEREEIIVMDKRSKSFVGIDPATGRPYTFIFVNNTSNSLGTFESPYPLLATAEANSAPGDIIYVFPGDGTTTGMSNGITLKIDQKLWGSGVSHTIATTFGTITLPNLTNTSPQITNTGGNGVTLATGNEVSGFSIMRASGNGIFGTSVGNTNLLDNTIFGSLANGISLTETSGDATINMQRMNILSNTLAGFDFLASSTANVNIVIENSEISRGLSSGLSLLSTGDATLTVNLNNNSIQNNNVYGAILDSTSNGSNLAFNINNNVIAMNGFDAVAGTFTGSAAVDVDLNGNQIFSNGSSSNQALLFSFQGASPSSLVIENNRIEKNHIGNFGITIEGGFGPLTASVLNNKINGNFGGPLSYVNIGTAAASPAQLTITNNEIIGNFASPVTVRGNNAFPQNMDFTFTNNQLIGQCADGIFFQNAFLDLNVTVESNLIRGNTGVGIVLSSSVDATILNFVARDNRFIDNSSGPGIEIDGSVARLLNMNVLIENNLITGNGLGGVLLFSFGNLNASIDANRITDNGAAGIEMACTPSAASAFQISITDNTITGSSGTPNDGIRMTVLGASTQSSSFTASNNIILNNLSNGILISETSTGAGTLAINIENNTFSLNQVNGLNILDNLGSAAINLPMTITGNIADYNNLSGINIEINGSGVASAHADANSLSFNNPLLSAPGSSGFKATTTSGSLCLELSGNYSDTGYLITQTAGTLNLAPTDVQAVNRGTVTTSGGVSSVSTCP
jgi:hypothetical protein